MRPEPRVRVELTDAGAGPGAVVQAYEAVGMICPKPRCACSQVRFHWQAATARTPVDFEIDLVAWTVVMTPELEKDPLAQRLAESLHTELGTEQVQALWEWFLGEKRAVIRTLKPTQVDSRNLPDGSDGRMVGFEEVFPFGLGVEFPLNQEWWAVDEQYCVQPDCHCEEALLALVKFRDATAKKITAVDQVPMFYYNYRTGAIRELHAGPAGSPAPADLLKAVRQAHANYNQQLNIRHLTLRNVYARQEIRALREQRQLLAALDPHPESAMATKIGRNEPCPCGSGLKYKRCCLGKKEG